MDVSIYTILEVEYKKKYKLPDYWYQIDDYKVMIEIISKAINNKKRIEDIEEYQKLNKVIMYD